MNKTELISEVARSAELTKKDAEKAIKAALEIVADQLAKFALCVYNANQSGFYVSCKCEK